MIIFSDFDRTLFFADDELKTRTNLDAIAKWRARGHQFCITTGRSAISVTRVMPTAEKLCNYFIVDGGSIILSNTQEILDFLSFDPQTILSILNFSQKLPEPPTIFYYTISSENTTPTTKNVTKLRLWFENIDTFPAITKQIRELFPVFAFHQPATSHYSELAKYRGFIEITPVECGKHNAIKRLQENLNIPTNEIITIGDDLNDYYMIRDFNGYAIHNSKLANDYPDLKSTDSLATIIKDILNKP